MEKHAPQPYMMELGDYIEILARRKLSFIITFTLVLFIGIVIAFTLPPVYRSEAKILIEKQEIPQDLVATTVTGYVQERIEGIQQRLITYENLREIAKDLDLFPELRAKRDFSTMVSTIRGNISVEMIDVKASGGGKSGQTATVAFTVGYEAGTPEEAQKVAAELAARYLKANQETRSKQTEEVSEFLEAEADRLRQEIVALERSLAKFKQQQSAQLPELFQVNMRLFEKTEGQIEATKDRILNIEDQITALQSELSLTDPRKAVRGDDGKLIQSPTERLRTLTSEYLQNSVRYAPTHPDMLRMQREIKALGTQSNDAAKISDLIAQLRGAKAQLLDARQKYTDQHPDVRKLEKSVANFENELRSVSFTESKEDTFQDFPADNPRYVSLKTQLDTANSNLRTERGKQRKLEEKLKEYERRLFQTPVVERDYQALTRDYGNAKRKYEELKNKQLEARLAVQLESGGKGERFVLESRAYRPTTPDKPNRLGITLLSGLLAFAAGIAAIALGEFKDQSLRGGRGVAEVFGALPIVVIPYIENSSDVKKQARRRLFLWIGFGLGLIWSILAMVHFFMMPLEQLIG